MSETGQRPEARRSAWLLLAALLTLSAVVLVWTSGGEVLGDTRDGLPRSLWLDHELLSALAELRYPGRSTSVHWPGGADSMIVAGGPLPALFALPWLLALGYPGFWNPFVAACLIANGLAAAWLAAQTGAGDRGRLLAGLAFGLAPAVLREVSTGNQDVFFAAPLPLALGLGLKGLTGSRRQALLGGAAVVLASLSWWPFGLLTAGLLVGLGLWKARREEVRSVVLDRLGWMARTWVPGMALLLPLLASRMRAADHAAPLSRLPEALADIDAARLDFALSASTSLPPGRLVALSEQPGEVLGSLLVLVLLTTWFLVQGRRQLIWPALLILSALASVGAWLAPGWDVSDGWLPLPLAWAQAWLPGLDGITRPQRFLVFSALAQAVMLGVLWTRLEERGSLWAARVGAGALALVLIAMPWAQGVAPLASSSFEPPGWIEAIDEPGAIVAIPLGWTDSAALWQPLHGQPISGGPGEVQAFASNSPTRQLYEERPELRPLWLVEDARLGQAEIQRLSQAGARWVVVDAGLVDLVVESERDLQAWSLPVLVTRIDEAFGPPVYDQDQVRVYRIPVLGEAP
jgi:hypothetical protein